MVLSVCRVPFSVSFLFSGASFTQSQAFAWCSSTFILPSHPGHSELRQRDLLFFRRHPRFFPFGLARTGHWSCLCDRPGPALGACIKQQCQQTKRLKSRETGQGRSVEEPDFKNLPLPCLLEPARVALLQRQACPDRPVGACIPVDRLASECLDRFTAFLRAKFRRSFRGFTILQSRALFRRFAVSQFPREQRQAQKR